MRGVHPGERERLVAWLDDGLREGRRGELEAEYPLSLTPEQIATHRVAFEGDRPVAHAMYRVARVRARGKSVPLGMIGLVYTDPAFRRRGLAGACVRACLEALSQAGVCIAALWSDRHDFYGRLGFLPAGRETLYRIDAETCRRARDAGGIDLAVGDPREDDWPRLESLYARKPVHAARPTGALRRLAAAPHTRIAVARRGGEPVAYAALGRGADFPDVAHEWAGEADALLACLESLCREHDTIGWLSGPIDEEPAARLRAAGAHGFPGVFALLQLLDAPGLLRRLVTAGARRRLPRLIQRGDGVALQAQRGALPLAPEELLSLLVGPRLPERIAGLLEPRERKALQRALPWPLYVWGFDSI